MNSPVVASVTALAREEGHGWRSLATAPRGRPVLLLVRESGGLVPAVGFQERGTWLVRPPRSSDSIPVMARFWAPIPRAPL
jgi:hypothetical protein